LTVQRLARDRRVVLMDLRGFTPRNAGVAYELATLVELYPLEQVVLAVDDTTDAPAVRATVEAAWRAVGPGSPNRARPETVVRVLRLDAPGAGAGTLLRALTAAAARAPDPAPAPLLPPPLPLSSHPRRWGADAQDAPATMPDVGAASRFRCVRGFREEGVAFGG
jgi:hypothetical protein